MDATFCSTEWFSFSSLQVVFFRFIQEALTIHTTKYSNIYASKMCNMSTFSPMLLYILFMEDTMQVTRSILQTVFYYLYTHTSPTLFLLGGMMIDSTGAH